MNQSRSGGKQHSTGGTGGKSEALLSLVVRTYRVLGRAPSPFGALVGRRTGWLWTAALGALTAAAGRRARQRAAASPAVRLSVLCPLPAGGGRWWRTARPRTAQWAGMGLHTARTSMLSSVQVTDRQK